MATGSGAESNQPNTRNAEKTSSDNSLSNHDDTFEGAIGEEKSSQPNRQDQIKRENAERGSRDILIESIKIDLGIIKDPATSVNDQPMFRVPEHIKQLNPDAYKPRLISIGPMHHGKPELRPMEAFKRRYAQNYIQRYSIHIEDLIATTEKYEKPLRNSYGISSSEIPSDQFVKIMSIDATFLVEFLLKESFSGSYNGKWKNVISDLLLLENQIPLYYLSEVLTTVTYNTCKMCDDFLDYNGPFYTGRNLYRPFGQEKHLLDRLRTRMALITNERGLIDDLSNNPCPTISQLHRAGIKICPNYDWKYTSEITFQRGFLKMPQLVIDHNTERHFANLLASELFADDRYASEYILLMDYFIDGSEDVRLLVERGVLKNYLEDDKVVASLINEIGRPIVVGREFHYRYLVANLKEHCNKRWVSLKSRYLFEWMSELKANYFGNPWKVLSVIAAIILLGLTVIQTVCSLLQLEG